MNTPGFSPSFLLRSPHLQTFLGSRGRKPWVDRRARGLHDAARRVVVTCADGVQLEAWVARQPKDAPTVILIHGWLGHARSGSNATVVYAKEDPVIPSSDFIALPRTLDVRATEYGGHCGFVDSPGGPSWIDQFLTDHFSHKLASQ